MPRQFKVAVVGATGAVGQEMLRVLEERNFPVSELVPVASERSAGKTVTFRGTEHKVVAISPEVFEGVDLALFSAGGGTSPRRSTAPTRNASARKTSSLRSPRSHPCPAIRT